MNFTHRLGNPALAAFIADQYESDRKPQRTPERVRMSVAEQQLRANMDKPPALVEKKVEPVLDIRKVETPKDAAIELIDGVVYKIEFTGSHTGTRLTRFSRWTAAHGWCPTSENKRAAYGQPPVLGRPSYLNSGAKSPKGFTADLVVLERATPED